MPPRVSGWRGTEMAVPVRARRARPADSSLWPYSSVAPAASCRATGRPLTVTPLCGVRTFLDGFASAAIARPVLPGHFSTAGAPPGLPATLEAVSHLAVFLSWLRNILSYTYTAHRPTTPLHYCLRLL